MGDSDKLKKVKKRLELERKVRPLNTHLEALKSTSEICSKRCDVVESIVGEEGLDTVTENEDTLKHDLEEIRREAHILIDHVKLALNKIEELSKEESEFFDETT